MNRSWNHRQAGAVLAPLILVLLAISNSKAEGCGCGSSSSGSGASDSLAAPGWATGFDGSRAKLMLGYGFQDEGEDRFYDAALGARLFFSPWLQLTHVASYRFVRAHDHDTGGWTVLEGVGDMSWSASVDVVEAVYPSRLLSRCPGSGDPFFDDADRQEFVKRPHVTLGLGAVAPTGKRDARFGGERVDDRLQPGSGVWRFLGSADLVQTIGTVSLNLGMGCLVAGEPDEYGGRPAPVATFRGGLAIEAGTSPLVLVGVDLSVERFFSRAELDGLPVEGTTGTKTSLALGASMQASPAITIGMQLFFIFDDTRDSIDEDAKGGLGGSVFVVLSTGWTE